MWVKLDDRFYMHPKVLATSLEGIGLFALGLSYAGAYETDGRLPHSLVSLIARDRLELVTELVRNGLWIATESGYEIHDFLIYNPSKASLIKERKAAKRRMKAIRARSGDVRPNKQRTPGRVGSGYSVSSSSLPVLSSEGGVGGGFDAFWTAYPNKVGKQEARKAWAKIGPTAEQGARIIAAVVAQKRGTRWTREGGRFIPNPATWLNQGRWDDEPNEAPPKLMGDEDLTATKTWLAMRRRTP